MYRSGGANPPPAVAGGRRLPALRPGFAPSLPVDCRETAHPGPDTPGRCPQIGQQGCPIWSRSRLQETRRHTMAFLIYAKSVRSAEGRSGSESATRGCKERASERRRDRNGVTAYNTRILVRCRDDSLTASEPRKPLRPACRSYRNGIRVRSRRIGGHEPRARFSGRNDPDGTDAGRAPVGRFDAAADNVARPPLIGCRFLDRIAIRMRRERRG